jgi:hypothetical protein
MQIATLAPFTHYDFIPQYADATGDTLAGLMLGALIVWTARGELCNKVKRDEKIWLIVPRQKWHDALRLSPRQADDRLRTMQKLGLIEKRVFRYEGQPTVHVWVNLEALFEKVGTGQLIIQY